MRNLFMLAGLLLYSHMTQAQSLKDTIQQIDELFNAYKPQNPGCQLAISRNGITIYSKAWGMADLEHQVPLTTNSIIEAGSVSKQFTAAAILLLAQQGKLSLDDDIRRYLPEIPFYGKLIRIQHLLHHTSGLRDWGALAAVSGWPRTTKTYSNDDVLNILSRQKALNNQPGNEFIYSNSNYNLLALIVKRVSRMTLAEFTRIYIFAPAGMTHTAWRDNFNRVVLNRAMAYEKRDTCYQTNMPYEYAYGHGGLITTAEDLLKWNEYYWNGKFGKPSLKKQLIRTHQLNNRNNNTYGGGLFITRRNGLDYVWHDGATAGYRAFLARYAQLNLSIAYISNDSNIDFKLLHKVEDLFFSNTDSRRVVVGQPMRAFKPVARSLAVFTGWFRNMKTGQGIKFFVKNDTLQSADFKLQNVGPREFFSGGQRIVFQPRGYLLITATNDTTFYGSAKPYPKSGINFESYTGKYYSAETDSKSDLVLMAGKLRLQTSPTNDLILIPTYKDGFSTADGSADIYFLRGKHKKIIGYRISAGRLINCARNVIFNKIR